MFYYLHVLDVLQSGKGGKSGPPGTKSGKGTRAPTPKPVPRTFRPVSYRRFCLMYDVLSVIIRIF